MGLFNKNDTASKIEPVRNPDGYETPEPMSVEERAEILRENAIQYMTELDDKDLEVFIESVRLIRDGRLKLEKVKTVEEKQAEREAKKAEQSDPATTPAEPLSDDELDDELAQAFLEDEPTQGKGYVDGITSTKRGAKR